MCEQAVRMVGVLPGPAGAGPRPRHDVGHRHLALPARHQRELVRVVGDLLEGQEEQRRDLELDHRAHACHRGTGREAGETLLGQRGVQHPLGPEPLGQPRGHVRRGDPDVLTQHEHRVVGGHGVGQGPVERFLVGQPRHQTSLPGRAVNPLAYRWSSAVSGSGNGLSSANSTAFASTASTSSSTSDRTAASSRAPWISTGSRDRRGQCAAWAGAGLRGWAVSQNMAAKIIVPTALSASL